MDDLTRVFVDTSKQVFQLHGVNSREEPVLRRRLSRGQFLTFFARLKPTLVGLEACGSSHYWAQQLTTLGHDVRLIAPQHVKPYVRRGKNDAADAEGGCEALGRPRTRFVPVKDPQAQAALMLVGVRERLIGRRTQLANTIRGHAAEFGVVAAKGLDKVGPLLNQVCDDESVPQLAKTLFAGMAEEWVALHEEIKVIEKTFLAWHRQSELSRRLARIPAIGPVGACLLVMKTPDAAAFKTGRDFSAWIGLTPKDHSTAGKQKLGGITRAGDERLRATLVAGATAVIRQVRAGKPSPWPWLTELLKKKAPKLAAVALANKLARIAWKMMISGEAYDQRRALAA